jgi:hypothetical protein
MNRAEVKRQSRQIFWKSLRAPFVMWWVILVKRAIIWDGEPTWFQQRNEHGEPVGEPIPVIRGDLPEKFRDYATPDERLPGGLYEPTVLATYIDHGSYVCAFSWLGLRNRAHGFAMQFAKPATRYWTSEEGLQTQGEGDDAIWLERKLLWFGLERLRGYRVYSKDGGATFWATPVWTIKRA